MRDAEFEPGALDSWSTVIPHVEYLPTRDLRVDCLSTRIKWTMSSCWNTNHEKAVTVLNLKDLQIFFFF